MHSILVKELYFAGHSVLGPKLRFSSGDFLVLKTFQGFDYYIVRTAIHKTVRRTVRRLSSSAQYFENQTRE